MGFDGKIGGASLKNSVNADDHFQRAIRHQGDNRSASKGLLFEPGGDCVCSAVEFSIDAPSIQKTPNKKTSTTEAVHCGAEPPEAPHKKESRRPDFSHTLNYSLNSYGVDTKTLLKKFNGSIPFGDIPENA
jgi:hypothetical protein